MVTDDNAASRRVGGTGAARSYPRRTTSIRIVLRLGFAVIGVVDVPRVAAFWTAALDLVVADEWRSEDWLTLHHADGSGRALGLSRSESPVATHPRVHLDLFVDTAAE